MVTMTKLQTTIAGTYDKYSLKWSGTKAKLQETASAEFSYLRRRERGKQSDIETKRGA